ncbi:EthD domain-containing protein [Ferrovibrio sp.]|uniref:EthD domain-containing protein n=1 Tax=Ferrovibrio sp. TaxID=1917215 RepID=UPI003D0F9CEA
MPSVKEFILLHDAMARIPENFRAAWLGEEGAQLTHAFAHRRNLVGNPIDGFAAGAYAGVAEYWRSDAASRLGACSLSRIPGVSTAESVHFLAEEFIIKEGRGAVKFMSILRRKPGISPAEFSVAWRMHHPLVVRSVPEIWGRFRGYRQNHVLPGQCRHMDGREMARPIDGIVEIWFDSIEELQATMMSERYREIIRPDEETFVDLPNTRLFVTEEVVVAE